MKRYPLLFLLLCIPGLARAQDRPAGPIGLRQCLDYSLANNTKLQKDRIGVESAIQSKREIVGALLPQINASSSFTNNIQKTTFAMPNFVNKMLPEGMQDPNASKYMTVTMGMDLSANWGFSLTQQLLNFSLYTALNIAKASEEMARMGADADMNDVTARTATLFYNAQILEHSMGLLDESLELMGRLSAVMEANRVSGLVRGIDADRVAVAKMNLETEKSSLAQALEIQKNLLKLEMGFPMDEELRVEPADMDRLESLMFVESMHRFAVEEQLPYRMFKKQLGMLELQRKAAVAEVLPMVSFSANYSQNYMGDHFYGETFNRFPVSMLSVNLRMPIFTGMSKNAKIKKAGLELNKAVHDEKALTQSLAMGYNNARMQMDQNRRTIVSQKRNMDLPQNVLKVTESNFSEGLASLSDVLNASSSLIQAQMNYINAVSGCVKAYIDLKKAEGTINDLTK